MSNKVLLVDDHPAMLMALRSMLLNQVLFEVVGQAINGEDCLKENKKTKVKNHLTPTQFSEGLRIINSPNLLQPQVWI
jgi:two-component system response regulator FimZ (fimbrial Z protein)/two-component system response regulator EvgA